MMLKLLLLAVMAAPSVLGGIMMDPGTPGQGSPDPNEPAALLESPEQMRLNARCNGKCFVEACRVADTEDCRNFIMCKQTAKQRYTATVQPCAFGTYWAGFKDGKYAIGKPTCDLPQNVNCSINYCAGRAVSDNYAHNDGNCKTYWTCTSKGPEPRCCSDTEYFDVSINQCVNDARNECKHKCPIKQDACIALGVPTINLDDNNCRTYWDCEDKLPHPVCCQDGFGYNPNNGNCEQNGCADPCPAAYALGHCTKPGVDKYPLYNSTSCRTFMKCNAMGGHERWCCPSLTIFDSNTQSCIERTVDMDLQCNDDCPSGFNDICLLKASGNPSTYLMYSNDREFEMQCPTGTEFDPVKCGCAKPVKDAPDNSCNMEMDILFDRPKWVRSGSQSTTGIGNNGTIKDGPSLHGRISYLFDGGLVFRQAFFKQALPNLYINIIFNPTSEAPSKQVLLSNCNSLELYLQNGRIYLSLITDNLPIIGGTATPVIGSVDYTPTTWNQMTVIYNGRNVYMLNEGNTPTFDVQTLDGQISLSPEGLDIGDCNVNRHLGQGYRGAIAHLQFSKCLKQAWIDDFNRATTALQETPPGV